jgi:DNA-binding transcriptional ArsR family regulator
MSDDRCELLCLDVPRAEAVRASLPDDQTIRGLAGLAAALADRTRLRLALALGAGEELCVCDLAWIAGASDKLVSHHLRALRQAGLAVSRRDGKIVFYRLTELGSRLLDSVRSLQGASL